MKDRHGTSVNISSKTLFHITKSLHKLVNILRVGLLPHYCLELFGEPTNPIWLRAVAMVSFCDLPVFLLKSHVKTYGGYGIGLTKRWGIAQQITPVLYTHDRSHLVSLGRSLKLKGKVTERGYDFESAKNADTLLAYLKPLEGRTWKKDKFSDRNTNFYDEREWRFVPASGLLMLPHLTFRNNKKLVSDMEAMWARDQRLFFGANDVRYLIVKNKVDARTLREGLKKLSEPDSSFLPRFTKEGVEYLSSIILTYNKMAED